MNKKPFTPNEAALAAANLEKLPEFCYAPDMLRPGKLIVIKRGDSGYYRSPYAGTAEMHNQRLGVTPEQMEAMVMGSMVGWHVPGANPDTWIGKSR